jgi:methyl coenzyme M reductase subunit D
MPIISTREEFIDNVKRRLGWPVISLELEENQIDDRVDEAIDFFFDFHYDGTVRTYLKHQLSATEVSFVSPA